MMSLMTLFYKEAYELFELLVINTKSPYTLVFRSPRVN